MSHFALGVFVPKETVSIPSYIEAVMGPYSEGLEVEEHPVNCFCVGVDARMHAREQTPKQLGKDIQTLRDEYFAMEESLRPEWEEHIGSYLAVEEALEKAHPLYQKPDPDCSDCQGTGSIMSTYNPASKWDWYVIGGRWNGWIQDKEVKDSDPYEDSVENNRVDVKDLLININKVPFAFLDLDGTWHEKGRMIWFGQSVDEKKGDLWQQEFLKACTDYQDHQLVIVDCHI